MQDYHFCNFCQDEFSLNHLKEKDGELYCVECIDHAGEAVCMACANFIKEDDEWHEVSMGTLCGPCADYSDEVWGKLKEK